MRFHPPNLATAGAVLGYWHERVADGYNNLGNCQDGWAGLLSKRGAQHQDTALLRQSIAVFGASRHLSDSLRALLSNPVPRQRWLELQFPANALAVEACYRLWGINQEPGLLEQAFSLAERNESMQLLEHLRKEQAEQTAGVPDTLLVMERHLHFELNGSEKALLALHQPERRVAATLWSVDDASNAELMRLFFKEIKNGSRKDEALRKAKIKFLDAHPHAEANPVYWAAVTAYGDMGAVELWGAWWVLGIGLLLFMGWRYWQSSSKPSKQHNAT